MNQSGRVALGGMITALCLVLMFLTGVIPVATYALPAISGVLLIVIVIEIGAKWSWMVYAAVSVLSLLFAADKQAAVLFVLFFGYYPILKAYIEKKLPHKRILEWILKFLVFNAAMIVAFFIVIKVLSVPEDSFTIFGIYLPWVFLLLGNFVFLIYDYALSGLIMMYIQKLHASVKRMLRLK